MCQFFIEEVVSQLWNDNVALKRQTSLKTTTKGSKTGGKKYKFKLQVSRQNTQQLLLFFLQVTMRTHTEKKSIQNTN